jgi:hypothetical protein
MVSSIASIGIESLQNPTASDMSIGPLREETVTSSNVRRRRVARTGPVCEPVRSLTGAERLVQQYKDRGIAGRPGKGGVPRRMLQLKAGGDWFEVPSSAANGLYEKIKSSERDGATIDLWIRNDEGGIFRWRAAPHALAEHDETAAFVPIPSIQATTTDNLRTMSASKIPVTADWLRIRHLGLKPHSAGGNPIMMVARFDCVDGEFFLPKSVKTFLCSLDAVTSFRGWGLRHLGGDPVRTVQRAANKEQRMILCNSESMESYRNFASVDADPDTERQPKRSIPNDQPGGVPKRARHS